MNKHSNQSIPEMIDQFSGEPNYSDPVADDFQALSRDTVPVRSLTEDDLSSLVRIDRRITGIDRTNYYRRKVNEAINGSGVRMSVVAEMQGEIAGFLMARVDYGEFGRTAAEAVIDTLGVDPAYKGQGVGQAMLSQLLINLSSLRVESVRTEVEWTDTGVIDYFSAVGLTPAQRISLTKAL